MCRKWTQKKYIVRGFLRNVIESIGDNSTHIVINFLSTCITSIDAHQDITIEQKKCDLRTSYTKPNKPKNRHPNFLYWDTSIHFFWVDGTHRHFK